MTTTVDIVNRALQAAGTRTNITSLAENSNEAIQANLILESTRDELLRMAPWNCARRTANLTYITSQPGTPENPTNPASTQWAPGLPSPPWLYEYQYPVDCLRPILVVPQFQTGFAGATPITTAVTGSPPSYWYGPPIRYQVGVDYFYGVTSATVAAGGTGYAVGDQITLAETPDGDAPIGAPAILQVATLGVGSAIATVSVVNQILGESPSVTGSYFSQQTNPVSQSSTTGSGTGATFNLTYAAKGPQRIILTNQEQAILVYVTQVTDPNVMDPLLLRAWWEILAGQLCFQLSGSKEQANVCIARGNEALTQARKADGNEGLTVNDITPSWIRVRGVDGPNWEYSPNWNVDWGGVWPMY